MKMTPLFSFLLFATGIAAAQPATTPLYWPDKQGPARNGVVPDADAATAAARVE